MSPVRTSSLVIETPEGISFTLLLASPITRFLAWIIDFLAIMALNTGLQNALPLLGILGADFAQAAAILGYFVISIGYSITLEWWLRGQTLGKRAVGLRVVDAQGLRLDFSQIVIRNLLRFIDLLPGFYLVGGIASVVTQNAQRLGDLAANTIVVREPKIEQPNLDRLLGGKFNSLLEYPHLASRLRQRVTPELAGIALNALVRREDFDAQARVKLFDDLTQYFQSVVEFPADAVESITSEQYVRNAAEILYRR